VHCALYVSLHQRPEPTRHRTGGVSELHDSQADPKVVTLICVWKGCSMHTVEISQLLQITLEILKVVGGYGWGIKIFN